MEAGWSPTAAVTARLAAGALAMAVFASVVHPGWLREARATRRRAVRAGADRRRAALYYNAVAHLTVGVALLLEYTAPILVVGWLWATTRKRPTALMLGGVVLAVAGIMLVLGIFGPTGWPASPRRRRMGPGRRGLRGVLLPDVGQGRRGTGRTVGLHPITLATAGLVVGAAAVGLLGVAGVMPLTFTANDTVVAGWTTSWLVPVFSLALIPTAIAYTLGIVGIARLRPRFASLVGLSEVMFAVLAAWVLLGEAVTVTQALGGVVVLVGLALARLGDRGELQDPVRTRHQLGRLASIDG